MARRKDYMSDYRKRKASQDYKDLRYNYTHPRQDLCLNCDAVLPRSVPSKPRKYCGNNKCQHEHARKVAIENGIAGQTAVKSHLKKKYDNKCQQCNTGEWQGKSLNLHIHHIDGDAYNNDLSNVMLLCPNCHSQTDNYGVQNKGKGRSTRKKVSKPFYLSKLNHHSHITT